MTSAVAVSDLELSGRRGLDLLALVAFSVISSFFTQNKGGDPSPRFVLINGRDVYIYSY